MFVIAAHSSLTPPLTPGKERTPRPVDLDLPRHPPSSFLPLRTKSGKIYPMDHLSSPTIFILPSFCSFLCYYSSFLVQYKPVLSTTAEVRMGGVRIRVVLFFAHHTNSLIYPHSFPFPPPR